MANLHNAALDGFQAGAITYASGRPDYGEKAGDWLTTDLALAAGKTVLEIGAGTGKFTRRLAATGAQVTAAEPVDAMRAQLQSAFPGVETISASAEALPLAQACVDAVVCAQSFHWFANPTALAEIRRVLKTGGVFGLIWNVRDERVPWVAALTEIMRPYEGGVPRFGSGQWRRLFPAQGFTPLRERRFAHGHMGTPEQVIVERTLSTSFIAALPTAERDWVAQQVRALIAASPEMADKTEVIYPYETMACNCTKIG